MQVVMPMIDYGSLALGFGLGVVLGGALDHFVLPVLVDLWVRVVRRRGR